jgi:hypothetical protein
MTSADQNGQQNGLVTNVNPYVAGMLAVTLGLKWADAIRRVCMYTKASDEHKDLYALLRGLFPVQELCGCMTALRLARRDILGQKMPLWSILLPAMIVHGLANFRGMKVRMAECSCIFAAAILLSCFYHVHSAYF